MIGRAFWMGFGLVALLGLGSCFHKEKGGTTGFQSEIIPDVFPLSPPDEKSLEAYALTLPVFEMTGREEMMRWMGKYTMKPVTRELLVTPGDGAQDSFAIRRVSSHESADQRIQVIVHQVQVGPPEETVYDLKRVPGGWKRLKTTRTSGEFTRASDEAAAAGERSSLKNE